MLVDPKKQGWVDWLRTSWRRADWSKPGFTGRLGYELGYSTQKRNAQEYEKMFENEVPRSGLWVDEADKLREKYIGTNGLWRGSWLNRPEWKSPISRKYDLPPAWSDEYDRRLSNLSKAFEESNKKANSRLYRERQYQE
jgi:hypothetical protein